MSTKLSVIVVGGGVSGLVAAKQIAATGHRVLILEARSRLGGRVHSFQLSGMKYNVEIGASWIHGVIGNPLVEVAKENGMPFKVCDPKTALIKHDGTILDMELSEKIMGNGVHALFGHVATIAQGATATPSSEIPISKPFFEPNSPLFSGLSSVDAFYARATNDYESGLGTSTERTSLRWWGFERGTEGPDALFAAGYSTLVNWLEAEVKRHGGEIILNEEVVKIDAIGALDGEVSHIAITATNTSGNTTTYEAPYAIVTLPLGVLKEKTHIFIPPLPLRRQAAISRLGFGLNNKIFLKYDRCWWDPVDSYFFLPDPDSTESITLPRGGKPQKGLFVFDEWISKRTPALCLFFGADDGEALEHFSDDELETWAEGVVKKYLGAGKKDVPSPSEIVITRWRSDPHARGSYCYIPITAPGEEECTPLDFAELARPVNGRVFFAGEHTHMDWYATVHGAWASGIREGNKIAALLSGVPDGMKIRSKL